VGDFVGTPMQFLRFRVPTLALLNGLRSNGIQGLNRATLCLQPHMAVMLQHLPAEMPADCLNYGVRGLSLRPRK
jgi:hypothetical protein